MGALIGSARKRWSFASANAAGRFAKSASRRDAVSAYGCLAPWKQGALPPNSFPSRPGGQCGRVTPQHRPARPGPARPGPAARSDIRLKHRHVRKVKAVVFVAKELTINVLVQKEEKNKKNRQFFRYFGMRNQSHTFLRSASTSKHVCGTACIPNGRFKRASRHPHSFN